MSGKVVRLRTFKDDMDRVRDGSVAAPPQAIVATPPHPKPEPKKMVPRQAPLPPPTVAHHTPVVRPTLQEAIAPQQTNAEPKPPAKPVEPPQQKQPTPFLAVDTHTIVPPRRSILAHDESLESFAAPDIESEGTIVTDTKRKRFRLFPAIAEAFTSWLFEKREELEERAKPKHTISPATERKEVIKEAAAQSAIAPRDDHHIVRERLRHVPRTVSSGEVAIKKASEVPAPSWTHTAAEQTHVVPQPEPVSPKPPAPTPAPIPEPVAPIEPKPIPPPPPPPPPAPAPEPVAPKIPEPEAPTRPIHTRAPSAPRRRPAYFGIAAASLVASAAGIGLAVWFFAYTNDSDVPPIATSAEDTFIETSAREAVPLGQTHAELMRALSDAHNAHGSTSLVEFSPTVMTAPSEETSANIADVLAVFSPNAPGSFIRSVTAIGFGSYRGEPFIILKTTSFDTALGGMLAWEEGMTRDLAPFFGTEVVTASTFTDIVHANRDMRILFDETGNDRLVYSFLNRSTILMSTDRAVIEDLAPLVP